MPEDLKDEIYSMFERSIAEKIDVEKRPSPKKIGVISTLGENKQPLEIALELGSKWDSEVICFSWVRYFQDLLKLVERANSGSEHLNKLIIDNFNVKKIIPIKSPSPDLVKSELEKFLEKHGTSVTYLLQEIAKENIDYLCVPIPLFQQEQEQRDALGKEVEMLLRKTSRSLPVSLIPRNLTGDENTVLVVVHPDAVKPLTNRILQFYNKKTKIILAAVLDQKLIDLYYLVQADKEIDPNQSKEQVKQKLTNKLIQFSDSIVATIRGFVEDVKTEIVSGSLGVSIQELVDKYEAREVLVYSRSNIDDLLDSDVDIIGRMVSKTIITIIWE